MYIYIINYYICSYFIYRLSVAIDNRLSMATSKNLTYLVFKDLFWICLLEKCLFLCYKDISGDQCYEKWL